MFGLENALLLSHRLGHLALCRHLAYGIAQVCADRRLQIYLSAHAKCKFAHAHTETENNRADHKRALHGLVSLGAAAQKSEGGLSLAVVAGKRRCEGACREGEV